MKLKKPLLLLCLGLFALYSVVGFFAYRAMSNEQQAIQFNTQQQSGQSAQALIVLIEQQLQQAKIQLSAITEFTDLAPDNLKQLIEKTPSIKNIFIINQRQLQYPKKTKNQPLTKQEQQFVEFIQPLVNDPSLFMQVVANESQPSTAGWYYSQRQQTPTLIYWQYKDASIQPNRISNTRQLVGYELAYSVFRANVIATLDQQSQQGHFTLFENGQLLMTNQRQDEVTTSNPLTIKKQLPYPLQDWSINYTSRVPVADNRIAIGFAALALLAAITIAAVIIYREMQRRIRLAKQQVQFVGQVSHELKTPLTNIQLYAEMLKENTNPELTEHQYLEVITNETQRLARLIQNVLDFNTPPKRQLLNVNILNLLQQIETSFLPHFAAKGLIIRQKLLTPISPDMCIKTAPDMLTQIINNLINNAEKYAANGKYIDIEVSQTSETLTVAIRDYGNAINKAEIKKITQPFYRINNHIAEGISGTGIGLTIAQQLADYLEAQLNIEALDQGMRFSIVLPYPSPAATM